MNKQTFGIRVLGAVLALALAAPLSGQVITADQQKRLYDYFALNDKFHSVGKQLIEGLMDEAPKFFGKYADALAVVNICNKFANAEDMEAFKGVVDIAESKIIEKISESYSKALGWVSWAKLAMELLNDFVITPARMDFALDGYNRSRAAGTDPEDALAAMRDWGQVEMEMKKAMREKYGDLIFSDTSASGLTLLPAWQKKMESFTKGWFEAQYEAKLQREAAEAFAKTLGKTLEELAGYDAQMLQMLKEAAETKPVRIYARPAQQTIKVGGTATFEIVGVLKDETEEVLDTKTFGSEGQYDKPGTKSVELTAAGLACTALIIVVRDEKPVSLAFRPATATAGPGEKIQFDLRATYEDGKTGIVDVKTVSYDKPGTYTVAGEYGGLTASAILVVARNEKPAALFVQPESVTIKVGETASINAVARYEDGAEETVAVRTVVGQRVGTSREYFSFKGLSASGTIVTTRDEKPVALDFRPDSATVKPGVKVEFTLWATFADGKREIVGLQVVSSDKPGTIPVSGEFGGLTATATLVVVRNEKPVALIVQPETATIKIGEKATITWIARYGDGSMETVEIRTIVGRTVGSTQVWCYFQGISASATVITVRDEKPVSLAFSPATKTCPPGEKAEFRLRAAFADGKTETVGVQIVSQDKPGTYSIEGEFGGLTALATLIVVSKEKPVSLAFVPPVVKVKVGEGGSWQVVAKYQDGREQVVGQKSFPAYDKPGRHTVSFEFMGFSAEGVVLVLGEERKASGLTFSPRDPTLSVGQAITLSLRASFQEGETTTTEVVDVIPVSYNKVGTYTVTGTYGGMTATTTITVIKDEKPVEVLVVPPTQTVEIGQKAVYAVVAVYESGERVVIATESFSRTDKAGTFPIKGIFNGVAYSGTITVVESRTVESVFLRPESQEVKLGGSATFELVVKYVDGGSEILKRQAFEGTKVGTLSVFMESGTRSASGWLVVVPLDVEKETPTKTVDSVFLRPETQEVKLGGSATFELVAKYSDGKTEILKRQAFEGTKVGTLSVVMESGTLSAGGKLVVKPRDAKEEEDPCAKSSVLGRIKSLTSLVNEGKAASAQVDMYYNKFMKVAGAKSTGGLCSSDIIAYCYANALDNAIRIEDILLEVEDLGSEILMLYGICPDLAEQMAAEGQGVGALVGLIGGLKGVGENGRTKVNTMLGRLAENGCDKQEVIDKGHKIVPPNVDPDFLESGGTTGGSELICQEWNWWLWWLFGGFGSSASSSNAWTMKAQAQGLTDFELGAMRFTGLKAGTVTAPDGGSGTFSIAGNNIRIQMTRSVVENGKSVTLTYTFLGTRTPDILGGTYTVERSDGGLPKHGNWRAEKKAERK